MDAFCAAKIHSSALCIDEWCLTFSVTMHHWAAVCKQLAAKIDSPEFRLHGVMTSAASSAGAKDKTEPETDSTF